MALYNNPYQYSFGVPGQMNQFQQHLLILQYFLIILRKLVMMLRLLL